MEFTINDNTIVSNITCRKCGNTLPPHTIKQHLDISYPIHTCPHDEVKSIKDNYKVVEVIGYGIFKEIG